ncbi:Ger(x)C family spore germination protein [Thermohalobacter berrensis]|uniref:Uncharacterized protein n=1 Tax=Thermohalobacter berrensis TaxID=99594 RepID=A0A419T046_9FIRM|nr:Ger(x)C family spore germination protein [Thermohalobacter berrensis]RKD30920.1 hypothetical protein BET03_13150 [Thermohalobacter berrensis]
MDKLHKIVLIFLITVLLGGCWDKIEINERAFVFAIGIDKFKPKNMNGAEEKRYIITYAFPNVKTLADQGGDEKPRFVIRSIGQNMFQVSDILTTRSNRTMFFGHTKVIIISEDVARDPIAFREVIDGLERYHAIGRKVDVLISKETAKKAIDIVPDFEPVTGSYLRGILTAKKRSARFTPTTLGDIGANMHGGGSILIPMVTPGETDLKVAGAAIIKNYRLIGWLGEKENRSVMFVKGEVEREDITTKYKDITIAYSVENVESNKTAKVEDGKIKVGIFVNIEGFIERYRFDAKQDLLDDKILQEIEKSLQNTIAKEIKGTIRKLQEEFSADVIGIEDYLSKFKPDIWEQVEDNWNEVFKDIIIDVEVDVKVRRIGMTR